MVGAVMVVGGGIGGIQAALDLAELGYQVYLVESKPSIGGTMAQLDKTFPTNDCAMCILSPKLVECGRHKNIELITYAEVVNVDGEAGNFEVTIKRKATFVDWNKCTGCGLCTQKCPVKVPAEFDQGIGLRKAIYCLFPQAFPRKAVIDQENCLFLTKGKCGLCARVCPTGAIEMEEEDSFLKITVGAIILAVGAETTNPELREDYRYGFYPNVVTSTEFERILSASGPYGGKLLRPGDKKNPEKIAWIQCACSRDVSINKGYCSSICCMYATKQAIIAKEHIKEVKPTIFYMDLRTYGKGSYHYVEQAKSRYGVQYIRSSISEIREDSVSGNLLVKYETEEGKLVVEEFNLIVLSLGLSIPDKLQSLASIFNVELNQYGFCRTGEFDPGHTSRRGIFVAGTFQSPQAIPETVVQASAAAAGAAELLQREKGKLIKKEKFIPEINVLGEPPRIGVWICYCGINIGAYVDVPQVAEYVKKLPQVVYTEDNLYTCSEDCQHQMQKAIKEYNINRVVIASCTPRTHEPLFQKTIRETGLNPYLLEMANIREQCSWCHMQQMQKATEKAKDLVGMAVAKARLLEPLYSSKTSVIRKAVVIGGGLAGITTALSIANQGFGVYLVEKEKELGGNLRQVHYTLPGNNVDRFLALRIRQVEENSLIEVFRETKIVDLEGFVGNFQTTIEKMSGQKVLESGVIIVATGAKEEKPHQYLYGEDERVVTQLELENKLAGLKQTLEGIKTVTMIQCVGSRNEKRPYCSRICCSHALKNALIIKEKNPGINIFVLYRDICTYGFREQYYEQAREKGVIFIRYDEDNKPKVWKENQEIKLEVEDLILRQRLILDTDLLVLSPPIIPLEENRELSKMLKVPLDEEGFFMEAHVKLRPVEFTNQGVFLAGLAHFPKFVSETISQAKAAAAQACLVLAKSEIISQVYVGCIDLLKCSGCGLCQQSCPFQAIQLKVKKVLEKEKTVAEINGALCKGCGICAASCRSGAIDLTGWTDEQIVSQLIELRGA